MITYSITWLRTFLRRRSWIGQSLVSLDDSFARNGVDERHYWTRRKDLLRRAETLIREEADGQT